MKLPAEACLVLWKQGASAPMATRVHYFVIFSGILDVSILAQVIKSD